MIGQEEKRQEPLTLKNLADLKRHIQVGTEIVLSQSELFHDVCIIIDQAQQLAYRAVNETLINAFPEGTERIAPTAA